jgi:hypothetical protein
MFLQQLNRALQEGFFQVRIELRLIYTVWKKSGNDGLFKKRF